MSVADSIRNLRKERGWSQVRLAMEAHVSQQAISFIERERNEPSAEMIRALANRYSVSILGFLFFPLSIALMVCCFTPLLALRASCVSFRFSLIIRMVTSFSPERARTGQILRIKYYPI